MSINYKEMVKRYEKMVESYVTAWDELEKYVEEHKPELVNYLRVYYRDCVCPDVDTIPYLRMVLNFGDKTYILDDLERLKKQDERFLKDVESLGYMGQGLYTFPLYESSNEFTSKVIAPVNILNEELEGFWLPLLKEQNGLYDLGIQDETDPLIIRNRGFIGALTSFIVSNSQRNDRVIQFCAMAEADVTIKNNIL